MMKQMGMISPVIPSSHGYIVINQGKQKHIVGEFSDRFLRVPYQDGFVTFLVDPNFELDFLLLLA